MDVVKSRLADPFIGSLVIAIALFHWEFFFALGAGMGSAKATLDWALHHSRYPVFTPPDSGTWWAFGSALFYTFAWPELSGWVETFRLRLELRKTNRITSEAAAKRFETAATLRERPEWRELESQVGTLMQALQPLWRALADQAGVSPAQSCTLQQLGQPITFDGTPVLLLPIAGKCFLYESNDHRADLLLGFKPIGTERMLCVSPGGIFPWHWPEIGAFTFSRGKISGGTDSLPGVRVEKLPNISSIGRFVL